MILHKVSLSLFLPACSLYNLGIELTSNIQYCLLNVSFRKTMNNFLCVYIYHLYIYTHICAHTYTCIYIFTTSGDLHILCNYLLLTWNSHLARSPVFLCFVLFAKSGIRLNCVFSKFIHSHSTPLRLQNVTLLEVGSLMK